MLEPGELPQAQGHPPGRPDGADLFQIFPPSFEGLPALEREGEGGGSTYGIPLKQRRSPRRSLLQSLSARLRRAW